MVGPACFLHGENLHTENDADVIGCVQDPGFRLPSVVGFTFLSHAVLEADQTVHFSSELKKIRVSIFTSF